MLTPGDVRKGTASNPWESKARLRVARARTWTRALLSRRCMPSQRITALSAGATASMAFPCCSRAESSRCMPRRLTKREARRMPRCTRRTGPGVGARGSRPPARSAVPLDARSAGALRREMAASRTVGGNRLIGSQCGRPEIDANLFCAFFSGFPPKRLQECAIWSTATSRESR